MKTRGGRLNITEFVNEQIVRKTAIVREETRPFRLKIEAWALFQARQKGVNVPRVLDYFQNSEGQEVLILERIKDGEYLSHKKTQKNIDSMVAVGSQMKLLKNISMNYGWINTFSFQGTEESWKGFISSYTSIYGNTLVRKNIINIETLQQIQKIIETTDLEISMPYLVNRDLKPSNIMRDNYEGTWILDWENVILGDPLYDLAIFGVREGHGLLWKNLVLGYELDISSLKYRIYESIALIGIIDFCLTYQLPYLQKQRQLLNLITRYLAP